MHQDDRPPRFIARQIAIGFGAVSIVSVVMCGMLLSVVYDVSELVSSMRRDESSIRSGVEIAANVRDYTLQAAQALIDRSPSSTHAYEASRTRVWFSIRAVDATPGSAESSVDALGNTIEKIHQELVRAGFPNGGKVPWRELERLHRVIIDLGAHAAARANQLAKHAESGMVHAHVLATQSTRVGLLGGTACVALVIGLSVAFTLRLRTAVLRPLLELTDAARRFGQGEFDFRVGDQGEGELNALGKAFDSMADELARREASLIESERMAAIGQLAAGVAHELNNPIAIIRGYVKTMSPDTEPAALSEELRIIDEEAAQCQRIAQELLSYARKTEIHLENVFADAFLGDVCRRFRGSPAALGCDVRLEASHAQIRIDPSRLKQVILNLLANAVQVSPAEEAVVLRARADSEEYIIEVEDHGPGIEPEDRQRIFEPFFSKRRGGSGLGLSVCLGIVQAHQGSIEVVDTEPGRTVFRVRLPLTLENSS